MRNGDYQVRLSQRAEAMVWCVQPKPSDMTGVQYTPHWIIAGFSVFDNRDRFMLAMREPTLAKVENVAECFRLW